MKVNSNTKIIGSKLILVPYRQIHVPKYHQWMKSEELQKLTASEPLSLDEEYAMQMSWRIDEDSKCTFIILDKEVYDRTQSEIDAMIGDTNIFVTDRETSTGEIEIMIAEESARGKKYGWEAVILLLIYGIQFINLKIYEAKISLTNNISINMFKKLNFVEKCKSEVFQEITLEKIVNEQWLQRLQNEQKYEIHEHAEIVTLGGPDLQ